MSNSFGQFPFNTISGKTGDAEGAPITIRKGDLVQIRLYNASEKTHSMHLHGQDLTLVDINGHPVTPHRNHSGHLTRRVFHPPVPRRQPGQLGLSLLISLSPVQRHEIRLRRRPGRHDTDLPLCRLRACTVPVLHLHRVTRRARFPGLRGITLKMIGGNSRIARCGQQPRPPHHAGGHVDSVHQTAAAPTSADPRAAPPGG